VNPGTSQPDFLFETRVFGRHLFDVVDYQREDGSFPGLEFEAQLILEGGHQRRSRIEFRRGPAGRMPFRSAGSTGYPSLSLAGGPAGTGGRSSSELFSGGSDSLVRSGSLAAMSNRSAGKLF